jgi:hypothetical protein
MVSPQITASVGLSKVTRKASPMVFTTVPRKVAKTGLSTRSWVSIRFSIPERVDSEVRAVKPWMSVNMMARLRVATGEEYLRRAAGRA